MVQAINLVGSLERSDNQEGKAMRILPAVGATPAEAEAPTTTGRENQKH